MLGWFSTRCCKTKDARKVSRRCSRSTELQMRANIKAFMVFLLQTGMIMDVDDHPVLPLPVRVRDQSPVHIDEKWLGDGGWLKVFVWSLLDGLRTADLVVFWDSLCSFRFFQFVGWMEKSFVNDNDYPNPLQHTNLLDDLYWFVMICLTKKNMSMHAHIHLINSIILDLAFSSLLQCKWNTLSELYFIKLRFPDMRSSGEGSPD